MFLGTYSPKLDDKGRLFLPAKFRDRLKAGIVVTRGHEKSLVIYPADAFESLASRVLAMPTTNRRARAYSRLLLSGASDQVPDKQGRSLCQYVALRLQAPVPSAQSNQFLALNGRQHIFARQWLA